MVNFIMVCGLPGSGKTTNAKMLSKQYNAVHLSSDDIRKELFGDECCQDDNELVFNTINKRAAESLKSGKNVVYDACNISSKKRRGIIQHLKRCNDNILFSCFVIYKNYYKCLRDNRLRERVVPERQIKNMLFNFHFPMKFEGWDYIKIIKDCEEECNLTDLFYGESGLCKIPHDNPHHSLSIGDHCIAAYLDILEKNSEDWNLMMAALLHDIGKPFVKGFKDRDGNTTEKAHYYQHHLVSAYFAVPYLTKFRKFSDLLETLGLIQYHMYPFFWNQHDAEKAKNKYRSLWGEEFFNKIMILHETDKGAH